MLFCIFRAYIYSNHLSQCLEKSKFDLAFYHFPPLTFKPDSYLVLCIDVRKFVTVYYLLPASYVGSICKYICDRQLVSNI